MRSNGIKGKFGRLHDSRQVDSLVVHVLLRVNIVLQEHLRLIVHLVIDILA